MKPLVDIHPNHLKIVLHILRKHLPKNAQVWVFGSRAKCTARKYSDLDLAIDCGKPIPDKYMIDLKDAFIESDLPYKVDVIDWYATSNDFKEMIAEDRIALNTMK